MRGCGRRRAMPRWAVFLAPLYGGLLTLVALVTALPGEEGTPAEPKGFPTKGETSLLDLAAPGPKLC